MGFKMTGFTPVASIDFKESAIKTYQLNFKSAKAIFDDILSMDNQFIRERLGDLSDLDVIIGGPYSS
ncbi:MAG: DNA cytosine methyltransferase [Sporomusaceae bacterium]|nr:DNA cytosine methyltransferase [Sporomusaceae bacterium]